MSVYYASLSWLAWRWERSHGEDAFHLVIAFVGGSLVLKLGQDLSFPIIFSIILASFTSWSVDKIWSSDVFEKGTGFALIKVIVFATGALVTFDWLTSNQPVELELGTTSLRYVFVGFSVVTLLNCAFRQRSPYGQLLRLGKSNQWAFEYWASPLPVKPAWMMITAIVCWATVLIIPFSVTGILSTTILKDVAISILIARVVLSRNLWILLSICSTIAILRFFAGYVLVSNIGPPVIELVVFFSLLIWIRKKNSRTLWEVLDVR